MIDTTCLMSRDVVYDKSRKSAFTQRVIDDTGISVFTDTLSMVKWNVNDSDANITYSSFFSKFKMLFDECFPLITKKAKRFRTNSKPWFTNGLNKSVWLQSRWLRCFTHRLISPMHQTCTRLLLMSSVDQAFALLNSSVNPSIQPELKTDAQSCCQ